MYIIYILNLELLPICFWRYWWAVTFWTRARLQGVKGATLEKSKLFYVWSDLKIFHWIPQKTLYLRFLIRFQISVTVSSYKGSKGPHLKIVLLYLWCDFKNFQFNFKFYAIFFNILCPHLPQLFRVRPLQSYHAALGEAFICLKPMLKSRSHEVMFITNFAFIYSSKSISNKLKVKCTEFSKKMWLLFILKVSNSRWK